MRFLQDGRVANFQFLPRTVLLISKLFKQVYSHSPIKFLQQQETINLYNP